MKLMHWKWWGRGRYKPSPFFQDSTTITPKLVISLLVGSAICGVLAKEMQSKCGSRGLGLVPRMGISFKWTDSLSDLSLRFRARHGQGASGKSPAKVHFLPLISCVKAWLSQVLCCVAAVGASLRVSTAPRIGTNRASRFISGPDQRRERSGDTTQ